MKTRTLVHEEAFSVAPETLFALLHTPSAIRHWWGAARAVVIGKRDGLWVAAWGDAEDDPDYITAATIRIFDPPERLVLDDYQYHARSGALPFEVAFVTEFVVAAHLEGAVLRVTQSGFPSEPVADDFYSACEKGWRETFAGTNDRRWK